MAPVDNPLDVFFDLVPTGAALYAPIYDAGGELVDFRFARLNPAGQRLLGLPAQPPHTFRQYYPTSVSAGIFAQYCTAYLTGQPTTYDVPYVARHLGRATVAPAALAAYQRYQAATDAATLLAFFYGDEAALQLGHRPLGNLAPGAGFSLARARSLLK